jgi:hypothetical protein
MRSMILAVALASAVSANAAAPVDYVPQDTPYLLTSIAPMPAAAAARMQSYTAPILEVFKNGFKQGILKSSTDDESPEAAQKRQDAEEVLRFFSELGEIYSSDASMLKAGFKPQALFALYGVGAVPVLRMEISDAAKASQTIQQALSKMAELAKREQAKKPVKERKTEFSFAKTKLRSGDMFWLGSEKVQPFVLIEGKQIVISALPNGAKADLLALVAPAAPVAGKILSSKLAALKTRYGFQGYGIGFIDFQALSNMWMGKPNKLEAALWAASSAEKLPAPSAECKQEMQSVLANMPRASMGYTELSGSQFSQKMVFELAPSIAQSFAGTVVPMPAYGDGAAFKIGFATDPLKTMNALRVEADKITKAPYRCETLLSLNEGAAKLKEGLASPVLGMAAMVKGFGISLDSMEMDFSAEKPEPRNMSGNVAVFTDQPEALYAMAQAQLPQLAKTSLTADGKPVKVDASAFDEKSKAILSANEGYAAMSKTMLIVGAGKGRLASLNKLANVPASKNGETFEFSYGKALLGLVLKSLEDNLSKMPEKDRAGMQQMLSTQTQMLLQLESLSFITALTKNGVEFQGVTRFAK